MDLANDVGSHVESEAAQVTQGAESDNSQRKVSDASQYTIHPEAVDVGLDIILGEINPHGSAGCVPLTSKVTFLNSEI